VTVLTFVDTCSSFIIPSSEQFILLDSLPHKGYPGFSFLPAIFGM